MRPLRRFRMLLPPALYLVVFLALNAVLFATYARSRRNGWGADDVASTFASVHGIGVLAYGAYRVFAFHPFYRFGYRSWLETTPWTWRKPLPVGPVRLVWEDAVILAAAGLPLWLEGIIHPLASVSLLLAGACVPLAMTFAKTGAWGFQYAVMFAVGLLVLLMHERPAVYAGAALLAYMLAMVGLGRSLKRWPWPDAPKIDPTKATEVPAIANAMGWPHDRLGPRADAAPTLRDSLGQFFSCALVGWWIYAAFHAMPGQFRGGLAALISLNVPVIAAIARLSSYVQGYAPPISLGGRIGRLRPILPSYDQVFASPLAAIFAATAGPVLLWKAGVPGDASAGICTALALMAIALGGPDRRSWQLTARHRVVAAQNAANKAGPFVQTG